MATQTQSPDLSFLIGGPKRPMSPALSTSSDSRRDALSNCLSVIHRTGPPDHVTSTSKEVHRDNSPLEGTYLQGWIRQLATVNPQRVPTCVPDTTSEGQGEEDR